MTRSKQPSLFPALLPTDEATPREKKEAGRPSAPKIALIDLNLVRPNPAEPRKTLNEEGLRQLADSIRRHGLLNPILVRREQHGTFTTLAGSRRLKACPNNGHFGPTSPKTVVAASTQRTPSFKGEGWGNVENWLYVSRLVSKGLSPRLT